jgi:hypothetical protein
MAVGVIRARLTLPRLGSMRGAGVGGLRRRRFGRRREGCEAQRHDEREKRRERAHRSPSHA